MECACAVRDGAHLNFSRGAKAPFGIKSLTYSYGILPVLYRMVFVIFTMLTLTAHACVNSFLAKEKKLGI